MRCWQYVRVYIRVFVKVCLLIFFASEKSGGIVNFRSDRSTSFIFRIDLLFFSVTFLAAALRTEKVQNKNTLLFFSSSMEAVFLKVIRPYTPHLVPDAEASSTCCLISPAGDVH